MKMLGRIALVIAILACAGALYFASKLGTQRDTLKTEKAQLTTDKTKLTKDLSDVRGDLSNTKQALGKVSEDLNTANGVIQAKDVAIAKKTQEAETLKQTVAEKSKEAEQAKTDLASAQETLKNIQTVVESDDFKHIKQIREQLSSQTEENKILGEQMVSMKSTNDVLLQRIIDLTTTPVNLRGHVAAVQNSWGFVVLDVGRDQRVQTNTDFLVYRDTKLVSKVQIRSVGATTSVAEILPEFDHPKSNIQPKVGDLVIH